MSSKGQVTCWLPTQECLISYSKKETIPEDSVVWNSFLIERKGIVAIEFLLKNVFNKMKRKKECFYSCAHSTNIHHATDSVAKHQNVHAGNEHTGPALQRIQRSSAEIMQCSWDLHNYTNSSPQERNCIMTLLSDQTTHSFIWQVFMILLQPRLYVRHCTDNSEKNNLKCVIKINQITTPQVKLWVRLSQSFCLNSIPSKLLNVFFFLCADFLNEVGIH